MEYTATLRAVLSVLNQTYRNLDVVIADNGSSNESHRIIDRTFRGSDRVCVLNTGKNLGYAQGNNFAIKWRYERGPVDYFLVLNSDICLTDPTTVEQLIDFAETQENLGALGPKVVLPNGFVQGPYCRPKIWLLTLQYMCPLLWLVLRTFRQEVLKCITMPKKVYRTIGACVLLKAKPFVDIGGFDENTFLYGEEDILAERLLDKKLYFYYLPSASVLHDHHCSSTSNTSVQIDKIKLTVDSMSYYFREYRKCKKWQIWLYAKSSKIYKCTFAYFVNLFKTVVTI